MSRGSTLLPAMPSDEFLAAWVPIQPIDDCNGLHAHVAPDVFGLWDAWEKLSGCECPIPYWAVPWPGAIALARYLFAHPDLVRGRDVIDLGCGGGIAGIAGLKAGARRARGVDTDAVALAVARRNAEANGATLAIDESDFLNPEMKMLDAGIVLAADLFYERSTAARTAEFLRSCARDGATVLIADGERAFAPATGVTLLHQERVPVNQPLEGVEARTVRILSVAGGKM